MRVRSLVLSRPRALVLALALLGVSACLDTPLPDPAPQARIVTIWDPVACGEPYRVVVELEDERGARFSRSAPCTVGGLTIDVPYWGIYVGRIYAWRLGPEIRSALYVRLEVDAPVVHWIVDTPQ